MKRQIRTKAAVICAVALGATSGAAVAATQGSNDQATLDELEATVAQAEIDSRNFNESVDSMWLLLAEKAERGELKANVDQDAAVDILRAATDPPGDEKAASELQDQMIDLTEQLRASGDMPSLDDASRFNADGTVNLDVFGE